MDFEMVKTASEQESKIGDPVQLSDFIQNHEVMKNELKARKGKNYRI